MIRSSVQDMAKRPRSVMRRSIIHLCRKKRKAFYDRSNCKPAEFRIWYPFPCEIFFPKRRCADPCTGYIYRRYGSSYFCGVYRWDCVHLPDGAGRRKRIRCVRHQLCRTERDEKPAETPIIPVAVCIHGTDSSMGNPDGNPSGEDCHGTDRAGHEQCRDRRIYAEYLPGKQGKGGTERHDRQPGTVCASKYWLQRWLQPLCGHPVLPKHLPLLLLLILSVGKMAETGGSVSGCFM